MRGRFTPGADRAKNGASGTCWRASTATPSSGCGARSSRSNRATSCASCSTGSTCRRRRSGSGQDALPRAGAAGRLRGGRRRRGKATCCPRACSDYSIPWLDDLCRAGSMVWTRLRGAASSGARARRPVRGTPIVLLPRRQLRAVDAAGPAASDDGPTLSPRAQRVLDACSATAPCSSTNSSAMRACCRWNWRTRWANWSHAASSTATASPACARCCCRSQAPVSNRRRGRGARAVGMEEAGRWALARRPAAASGGDGRAKPHGVASAETLEHIAMTLLRRYGVMFWRLLEREAAWLPSWRELLPVYHRLEARGEIRGGRFVAGFSGEQFALPEAIRCCAKCAARARRRGWRCRRRSAQPVRHGPGRHQGAAPARRPRAVPRRLPVATSIAGEIALAGRPACRRATRGAQGVAARTGSSLLTALGIDLATRTPAAPGDGRLRRGWGRIGAPSRSAERS